LNVDINYTLTEDVFPGLDVKIKTLDKKEIVGRVKIVLTKLYCDNNGVFVELESGEQGNIIEVIQTKSEIELNQIIIHLQKDLKSDEGQYVEFKETFAYPTKSKAERVTSDPSIKFYVGKTVQAFANSEGGVLYIGIKDRVRVPVGLDADFSLLKEGNRDYDGLEIEIKNTLKQFFQRDNEIFAFVRVKIVKFLGKDVCVIQVKPSPVPFCLTSPHSGHTKDYFYIRISNSSENYTANKFLDYWLKRQRDHQIFADNIL